MEAALKYALRFVDLRRTEREIVKYVNHALMIRYYGLQSLRNGFRRVRKGGVNWMVQPRAMSPVGTVIGMEVGDEAVWRRYITEAQAEFLQKLAQQAATDLRNGETSTYGVTREGYYVMSGARAAEISGLSCEAARKRLSRIRKKVRENKARFVPC
ncbi:hypothetical protein ACFSVM_20240 [Paenibacillus shunpengii]|uniref:Sigma-70 family RNA polymerase sigma factor n=2 Tax=Paenibacillus shunpengii TaxID=2054424 RepID=A0ABW5SU17_9BACL